MSSLRITPATLQLADDGTPWSETYGDVYHSVHGAFEQARHVFLRGNGLPERWRGRDRFVVLETGFGLGHNFLATWQAWRDDPQASGRLHFISVEKHPFTAEDLATVHHRAGAPEALALALHAQWPMLIKGFHRLEFDGGRVVLTLLFGDACEMLLQCQAKADAIYLDGFAPSKNADMWSLPVFKALFRLAHAETTLATWSVSGSVRENLQTAGFRTEKAQGFTGKREMLVGRSAWARPMPDKCMDRHAIVIGAGLAGTAICERLAKRGWRLTLLEAGPSPAQGASGNLAGTFRPQPSTDDNMLARLSRAGFLYGLRALERLARASSVLRWQQCGVLHIARDDMQVDKQKQALALIDAPHEFARWVEQDEASTLAGQPCSNGGWWFPLGGWINPPSLCQTQLEQAGKAATTRFDTHVERIEYRDGQWHALDATGQTIAAAPELVLANAFDAQRLSGVAWQMLEAARGQVTHAEPALVGRLDTVVCGGGYVTPALDGQHALGATFQVNDFDPALRAEDHAENLDKLGKSLPAIGTRSASITLAALPGRVSQRPITSDRLPLVGPLPDSSGLWLLSGYGARGLVWGQLCAEILACHMNAEPMPVEAAMVKALLPARYRKQAGQ